MVAYPKITDPGSLYSEHNDEILIGWVESTNTTYLTLPVSFSRMQFKMQYNSSSLKLYVRIKWSQTSATSWSSWKQLI